MVESRSCVQREGVYRWFSSLSSAQRAEFLCGLLDLCVPIELRFLGSCLEDLARKDYHSLRDAEIKANNPTDLSGLTNITDEVVRSKLLVSLALLGSDNREAAGVLYRTLTHIDSVINNYGLALNDGRTEEQFLLLFTVASNHPAFSFHQKQVLRQQLGQIQDILQASGSSGGGGGGGAGGGGAGEAPPAGAASDCRASVCYPPPQPLHQHPAVSLPPAAFSLPAGGGGGGAGGGGGGGSATFLPLSAGVALCTCSHKSPPREAGPVSGLGPGLSVGQGDQAVTQELPDLRPPLPPPPPPPPPPATRLPPSPPANQSQDAVAPRSHQGKPGKVVIEKVVLRGATHKSEDDAHYVFEVSWSDGFLLSVVRSQQEVVELMSQLSQVFPDEGLEKFLPQSKELDPRCLATLPCHVLQHHSVQLFFTSPGRLSPSCPSSPSSSTVPPPSPSSLPTTPVAPTSPFTSSSNVGCVVQHRGANRAVYRVASVQPVVSGHSSILTRSAPHLSSIPPLPLPPPLPLHSPKLPSLPPPIPALSAWGDTSSSSCLSHPQHIQSHSFSQHHLPPPNTQHQSLHLTHSHPSLAPPPPPPSRSLSHPLPPVLSQPGAPEQNGILDWLRRLRLHKYYPVFKQLTMEEFLALTEEDLNKYDLTQGAKKKLKTQLELQKSADREMKMETRSSSSIARVTPSSHMGPSTHPTSTSTGELRVEVDGVLHHHHHHHHLLQQHHPVAADSSSSSGYSSSSCSPRTPHCCDSAFDRSRDVHRRVSGPDAAAGGPEKDRSGLFVLSSGSPSGSGRPTAQVLPVQTDPAPPPPLPPSCSSSSSHLPFGPPQPPYSPQASYPQTLLAPISNPARILTSPRKPRPPPLCTEDWTKPLGSGLPAVAAGFGSGLGVRLENVFPGHGVEKSSGLQEAVAGAACRGVPGLMVETSSALTSTSNSLHHVSQPPLHFHLSSSSSPTLSGYYSYPPTSSSSSSCASSQPALPGNSYYPPQPTSSPSPSPASASSLDNGSTHSSSMCVCSSCGCRGSCGAYGALPGYAAAGYLQPFSAGPSLFTLGPLLHLSPLIASSSSAPTGAAPFSYPMMVPPPLYRHSPAPHDLQQGFGFYQPHGIMGNGGQKRAAGNLSCYNCGTNGHRAEDCKQPPMDSAQQGTFRLKYTPHADSKDAGD